MEEQCGSCGGICGRGGCKRKNITKQIPYDELLKQRNALAETIRALRDIVTTDHETKADFINGVNAILSDDPDERIEKIYVELRKENEALKKWQDDASYALGVFIQLGSDADSIKWAMNASDAIKLLGKN